MLRAPTARSVRRSAASGLRPAPPRLAPAPRRLSTRGLPAKSAAAPCYALALLDQHVLDGAGDLAADLDPVRRLDVAAGDHGLHQIAALDLIDHDRGAEQKSRALPGPEAHDNDHREDEPSMRQQRSRDDGGGNRAP